jgi:opacity protein-like surface antigen
MKIWGLGVAGLALAGAVVVAAAPANADGLRSREHYHDHDSYDSTANWGGLYVGGYAGFAHSWGEVTVTTPYDTYVAESFSATDVTAGAILGYNIQHGHAVYGIESAVGFIGDSGANFELRGRYGFATNNWLYYGAVGVAFGGAYETSTPFGTASASDTAFLLGGGAETKIAPNLNLGLEGQFYLTGNDSVDYGPFHIEASSDTFVLRGRLTWQLGR